MMQKVLLFIALSLGLIGLQGVFAVDVDQYLDGSSPYDDMGAGEGGAESVDLGKELQDLSIGEDGVLTQLLKAMGFDFEGTNIAVQFISNIINFFLVTIGLVALFILLFGFYKMLFSGDQEGFESARKLILNTVIALIVIGLAWFITNFLFDLFYTSSQGI